MATWHPHPDDADLSVSARPSLLLTCIVAATAWMRIHLMGDTSLRAMFYGSTCKLCTDTTNWKILGRKMMDQ